MGRIVLNSYKLSLMRKKSIRFMDKRVKLKTMSYISLMSKEKTRFIFLIVINHKT